jgi:branched-chain amino acid transport system ATP-binding protein
MLAKNSNTILEVQNITMKFGELCANKDVSFEVERGKIVALIGPNGAGKTTIFNCIAGYYKPFGGEILFEGEKITGLPSWKIARKGLARTFQVVRPLREMTVLDNIMVGAYQKEGNTAKAREIAKTCLKICFLEEWADRTAGDMTEGNKKRLEVARALATRPRLLLLDEAVAGLTSTEVQEMVAVIKNLKAEGISILMVEHIMEAIMPIADKVVVLSHGERIAQGPPAQIVRNQEVITAYFGEKYAKRIIEAEGKGGTA